MNRARPSASLYFGAPASITKGFAKLPPAMQRDGLLLMMERDTPPTLIEDATGLQASEIAQLRDFPPRPFVRVIAEPVLSAVDISADEDEPSPLPVRERKILPPTTEEELKLMARDICPIQGVIPAIPVILDRAALRHGYHGAELTDPVFRATTVNARVDAYRLLLMLRDEMTISDVARLFGMGRNAIVCALKKVGWVAK